MVLSAAPEQIHCTESCDWMRDCSFSRCILSIHWSGHSIAWWLHGWCPVNCCCLGASCIVYVGIVSRWKFVVIISTGQIFKGRFNFLLGIFKVNYVHRMKVWRMNLRSSCMNMHVFGGSPELHRTVLWCMLFAPSTTMLCSFLQRPFLAVLCWLAALSTL